MRPLSEPTPQLTPKAPKISQKTVIRQRKISASTAPIKSKKQFPWRPIVRIIFFACVVSLAVWLANSPIFTVRNVTIDGLKTVDLKLVSKQIPSGANLWLFPTKKTEDAIRKSSPLIADVVVYRVIPDSIKVVVVERVMAAEWRSNNASFLVGLDGKVIVTASPPYEMPVVVDTTNIAYTNGESVATPGFIHFITTSYEKFNIIIGQPLDHFEVGATTFDVTAIPKSGPKIILDATRDPIIELKAAKLVLDQFPSQIKEYLDVRVVGKAYYK
ncbi:MAG: FtsQ-type POTRA domain-containing protein [Patescibacteria group bacterium]|jgi:hypothetical protein